MRAVHLKTDYRISPIGIENPTPLFLWKCEGQGKQVAYQVHAKDIDGVVLFDSGKIKTSTMRCKYNGKPLTSSLRVTWQVTLWDTENNGTVSEVASFEMGLLVPHDWQAKWICGVDTDKEERLPADYYKKDFILSKPVKSARLYATACGVYTALVNNHRVSDILAPGWTQYDKRLHYQTYDVTEYLSDKNTLTFTVGDGWYKGKIGNDNHEYMSGKQTKLLAQLNITHKDGTQTVIGSDGSFLWCNDGPIGYNDMKDGEVYDARRTPSYSGNAQETDHLIHPIASPQDGIIEHERFVPKLITSPLGAKILDFGQNLSGYIRFKPRGNCSDTITLKMFEILDKGEYTDATIRNLKLPDYPVVQQITYTCAGGDEPWFQPDFFYAGFQYAWVEGLDNVNPKDFEAVAIYTKIDFVGKFSCSNESINKFLHNTVWSLKGNFHDVPTDCPHREKNGWTGDAQLFAKTATYLSDTFLFFRKWLKDVRDCQRDDGRVANVCPKTAKSGMSDVLNGAVGWADAAVIIPYTLWKTYGDNACITDNYDLMHGWKAYVIKLAADKSIYNPPDNSPQKQMHAMIKPYLLQDSPYNHFIIEAGIHFGEWCEPGVEMDANGHIEIAKPKPELTSAYMHYSMTMLAEMLVAIGKNEEAAQCREYAEGARKAYNFHFVKDNTIRAERQAPYVRALALGLLDDEAQMKVACKLNDMVVAAQYTVGTGFLSTPFILQSLVQHGYVDTAYKMLENNKAPGWLAMIEQGATTVWERYDAYNENGSPKAISLNHYSLGAVCGFLYDTVCGISIAGNNKFNIKPIPGGSLRWAEAEYDSVYGKVFSRWEKTGCNCIFKFKIPSNTSAEIHLPDGEIHEVSSGTYIFETEMENSL